MKFLKIGHHTNASHGTGITVFLFDKPAEAAYCLCGSSPATREVHTLDLEANTTHIDGLLFGGGSAFGLGAVDGVMQWFKEQQRGKPTPFAAVPIVPAACIYDLGTLSTLPPTAEEAYEACAKAKEENFLQGLQGAGTGATVGKLVPGASRMPGGLGFAHRQLGSGLEVLACAVVNAVGDIRDAQGNIIAGAQLADGSFADCEKFLLTGQSEYPLPTNINTTLVAVFTNAKFNKPALKRIAKIGSTGMARAISPVFTRYDGDLIFTISLGEQIVSETVVGTLAAETVRQAICNAVKKPNL